MGLSDIKYKESARSQRIRAGVRADGITVTYPKGYRQEAENWARQQWSELLTMYERVCRRDAKRKKVPTLCSEQTIQTLTFTARVLPDTNEEGIRAYFRPNPDGLAYLDIHYNPNLTEEERQPRLVKAMLYFLRREANRILPARLAELAATHSFTYNGVHIHKTHSRWGSCSSQKIINLSCFLLFLPAEMIDLVLLHELCHTRQMNHGPLFWAELDQCTGGRARQLDRQLKVYEIPRELTL